VVLLVGERKRAHDGTQGAFLAVDVHPEPELGTKARAHYGRPNEHTSVLIGERGA
jgi:hypothetical protein